MLACICGGLELAAIPILTVLIATATHIFNKITGRCCLHPEQENTPDEHENCCHSIEEHI